MRFALLFSSFNAIAKFLATFHLVGKGSLTLMAICFLTACSGSMGTCPMRPTIFGGVGTATVTPPNSSSTPTIISTTTSATIGISDVAQGRLLCLQAFIHLGKKILHHGLHLVWWCCSYSVGCCGRRVFVKREVCRRNFLNGVTEW